MAELEEYISLFITYMAYKQDNQDAPISSLGLENIPAKDFENDRAVGTIEALTSQDIEQNMMADDAETEDEFMTDPRMLRNKFDEKYAPQLDKR